MKLHVNRINLRLDPDYKKVIPRFFSSGTERSQALIIRVLQMSSKEAEETLEQVLAEFSPRYRDIKTILLKHFELIKNLMPEPEQTNISETNKLLLGSYFTMEYAIEAAALFNPSIVEDPDQSGAGDGEEKVIVSFRATGESHISSLVFKRGTLDKDENIIFEPSGKFIGEGALTEKNKVNKQSVETILTQLSLPMDMRLHILEQLKDPFNYKDIELVLKSALLPIENIIERKRLKYEILNEINTDYVLNFPSESHISERVIFPVTYAEKNGIEDARFVRFTSENGHVRYIATYTAYDGVSIHPHLIETNDFLTFKVSQLHGKAAVNKNLALFPRKINGQYAMASRIDGLNNYIMFSDDLYIWEEAEIWQRPKYPWEFVQIGNGGPPIETKRGWLVITHGVGPMRKYCLGASLFDLNDPRKEIGRLDEPLLMPNEAERYGYVPNVVYTCGSMIHGDHLFLFLPYAVSDYATSFSTIPLNELLDEIMAVPGT
jgi:predicted GH43/DUF377 family glycosyl hydrolase